ncbi:hypothetical protein SETIT_5G026600v2 [Setaria italica]|uniref:Uncharacterized protein n=1 Tax=Setaria italica TaxID=4555 RepID=K3XML4_SETIT|nr:hypothetical protein SETIT_5G026600v2 [Setaria italica]
MDLPRSNPGPAAVLPPPLGRRMATRRDGDGGDGCVSPPRPALLIAAGTAAVAVSPSLAAASPRKRGEALRLGASSARLVCVMDQPFGESASRRRRLASVGFFQAGSGWRCRWSCRRRRHRSARRNPSMVSLGGAVARDGRQQQRGAAQLLQLYLLDARFPGTQTRRW